MYDLLPTPIASPPGDRPPGVRAAAWVATAIGLLGVCAVYLGTRIPNASIMNIGGMIAMGAGFVIAAVGFGSLLSLLSRDVGARIGIVAANAVLAACALLALPMSVSAPGAALLTLLLVVLPLTLVGLVLSPPVSEWMRVGATANKERHRQRLQRRMEVLEHAPPAVQVAVAVAMLLLAGFYIFGPSLPNGPVAAGLHERVDLLRLDVDLALGPPVEHEEEPRRFQLVQARERRRWVVHGDVSSVTQLVRDYLTSLTITEDEAGHLEAEQCRVGVTRRGRACHLSVTIDVREVGADLVQVELEAWASAHRY